MTGVTVGGMPLQLGAGPETEEKNPKKKFGESAVNWKNGVPYERNQREMKKDKGLHPK